MHHPFGILLCILIALLGFALSTLIPMDMVTLALLIGFSIGNVFSIPQPWKSGIDWSEKQLLGIAIALYGIQLDFSKLQTLGIYSIIMILCTIATTLLIAKPIAKMLGIDEKTGLMIGIGTAICGSAAIAATKDIIEADEGNVGISIAAINFIGTFAIFILPILGLKILHLEPSANAFMIGNSLQAVGQVVAAGFSVDDITGEIATLVKMGRVLMLTPLILILLRVFVNQNQENPKSTTVSIPKFILGFIAFSILGSLQIFEEQTVKTVVKIAKMLLIVSMAGIGLKVSIRKIRDFGLSALGMSLILFLLQLILSIVLIKL